MIRGAASANEGAARLQEELSLTCYTLTLTCTKSCARTRGGRPSAVEGRAAKDGGTRGGANEGRHLRVRVRVRVRARARARARARVRVRVRVRIRVRVSP